MNETVILAVLAMLGAGFLGIAGAVSVLWFWNLKLAEKCDKLSESERLCGLALATAKGDIGSLQKDIQHMQIRVDVKDYVAIMCDSAGIIIHATEGCMEILGWTSAELVGLDIKVVIAREPDQIQHHDAMAAAAERKTVRLDSQALVRDVRRKDGRTFLASILLAIGEVRGQIRFVGLIAPMRKVKDIYPDFDIKA